MELVDIIYRYGGEQATKNTGNNTPIHVLKAYEELRKLRQEKGDHYPLIPFLTKKMEEMQTSIDKETSRVKSEKCFKFVQQVVMKKPKVLELTRAIGGMYSQWSNQGIQCCIFPRDDNDSLIGSMQYQSQWSSLVKCIHSVIKENRKEKLKAWLCRYHAVGTGLNDFVRFCVNVTTYIVLP